MGRVLSFDCDAAHAYAQVAAERRKEGRSVRQFGAQIIAIARSRDAATETRNVSDSSQSRVIIHNPWVEN